MLKVVKLDKDMHNMKIHLGNLCKKKILSMNERKRTARGFRDTTR